MVPQRRRLSTKSHEVRPWFLYDIYGSCSFPFFPAGGKAVANTSSVADGGAIIKAAEDAFGGVSILINNAGILRDKGCVVVQKGSNAAANVASCSFKNMSDKEWDQIMEVHLKGAFACTKAAWPIFRKQKFGRVVNIASAAGLYGESGYVLFLAL